MAKKIVKHHEDVDDLITYSVEDFDAYDTFRLLNMRNYLSSAIQNTPDTEPKLNRLLDAKTRLKSILALRPHIPTKKETKELRRLRAKQSY